MPFGPTDTVDDQRADDAYELTPAGRSLLWLRDIDPSRIELRFGDRPTFEEAR